MITIDFSKTNGKMKPMHCVNNGPVKTACVEQTRDNFEAFKALKLPYVRNHDASFYAGYGDRLVDVHDIFPDFSKNPYDPASYDFFYTDQYLKTIAETGAQTYYRLGTRIEHGKKKYGSLVPADFHKWAVICEHIIRHYNEGWANGFHLGLEYWQIWNEPDGIQADGNKPNWSGTYEDFYEFYLEVAPYLKTRFPNLKIGGPALAFGWDGKFKREFLAVIKNSDKKVPLDFLAHHTYSDDPNWNIQAAERVRQDLDDFGFYDTENICDEWNYLESWTDKFVHSIKEIIGIRGAAFIASVMALGQYSKAVDMLMYYDARPCEWNGLFDFYTFEPLKGYYPFLMFSKLYQLKECVEFSKEETDNTLYVVAATDAEKNAAMVTYFPVTDNHENREMEISLLGREGKQWKVSLLDQDNTMTERVLGENGKYKFTLKENTVLFFEQE